VVASSTIGLITQSRTVHVLPRWSTVERGGEERCIGIARADSAVFIEAVSRRLCGGAVR
jgi:hypothetical protein